MALIGQHQQTSFANPQNGQSPIDADVVRGNDNAVTAKHNSHDVDATIHVQTGTLAVRPAAGTANAMYLDENGRFYRDNGTSWVELPYLRLSDAGTQTVAGNVVVEQNLAVDGLTDLNGNTDITGDLVVSGTVTAAGFTGPTTVPASNVTSGTFATGNFTFPGTLTVTSSVSGASFNTSGAVSAGSVTSTGQVRAGRSTQTGFGTVGIGFGGANHVRLTMTGNATVTLSGGTAGGVYTLEALQDGVGGRAITWANVVWAGGITPIATTTANRKDVYTFFFDGVNYLGVQFGANFASTA